MSFGALIGPGLSGASMQFAFLRRISVQTWSGTTVALSKVCMKRGRVSPLQIILLVMQWARMFRATVQGAVNYVVDASGACLD